MSRRYGKIQHGCDICESLFWAPAGERNPTCPTCGNSIPEEDWEAKDDFREDQ